MSTICITTGVPGCGKSYVRCARFLYDNFLPNSKGVHYSNFPVNAEVIADTLCKSKSGFFSRLFRRSRYDYNSLLNRVVRIPEDVILSWRNFSSGPWEYFKGKDLRYAHIAIDEIHEICRSDMPEDVFSKWDEFLGTIRHRGCTIEGLTQDISLVSKCFVTRCSLRYELIPCEDLRDPFFKIPMSDWYQLKASFTGEFHKTVFQLEFMKQGNGRFKKVDTRRFLIEPFYFPFYYSYSACLSE